MSWGASRLSLRPEVDVNDIPGPLCAGLVQVAEGGALDLRAPRGRTRGPEVSRSNWDCCTRGRPHKISSEVAAAHGIGPPLLLLPLLLPPLPPLPPLPLPLLPPLLLL